MRTASHWGSGETTQCAISHARLRRHRPVGALPSSSFSGCSVASETVASPGNARPRIRGVHAAALLDVLNPLANIRLVLAGQVSLHELPQKLGRTVLVEIGRLGSSRNAWPDRDRRAGGSA